MEVVLRKYGNSTVLALLPAALKELGRRAGQVERVSQEVIDDAMARLITLFE